jgi:arabinofuranosyltransferase
MILPEQPTGTASSTGRVAINFLLFLIFVFGAVALLARGYSYYPFLPDDVFIGLRYADRLLDGKGLTWTDGARVEGYSNLLWVLATAALGGLALDLVSAVRLLSALGVLACLAAVAFSGVRRADPLAAGIGVLGLVCSGAAGVWTLAGFEHPGLAALVTWAVVLLSESIRERSRRRGRLAGVGLLLALATLTRADAIVLVAAIGLGSFLARGVSTSSLKPTMVLMVPSVLAFLGQTAFRVIYYGAWLPNTALVKVVFSGPRVVAGLHYVGSFALAYAPLPILCVLLWLWGRRCERRLDALAITYGVPVLLWMGYVVLVGGDIFPAYRQLLVTVVLCCSFLAVGVSWIDRRQRRLVGYASPLAALFLIAMGVFHLREVEHARTVGYDDKVWEWKATGLFLRAAFGHEQPLVGVIAAGAIPYWSRLPALDLFGLNDAHIARFGKRLIGPKQGHDLWDTDYIASRRPDLIILTNDAIVLVESILRRTGGTEEPSTVPVSLSAGSLDEISPSFVQLFRDYDLVRFEVDPSSGIECPIHVRRDSPKLGIRRTATEVVVPAYLLVGNPKSRTRLDRGSGLTLQITSDTPGILRELSLPAGQWRVRPEPPDSLLDIAVENATRTASSLGDVTIDLAEPGVVQIKVTPAKGAKSRGLRALRLHRSPG